MAEIINMPRLSDTMEEGTVVKWFKKTGDKVNEGDILAEIETDKATMEFESFNSGILLHIGINEGESALVDSLLAIIGDKDEDVSSLISGKKENIEVLDESKNIKMPVSNSESSNKFEVINMPRLSDTMEKGTVVKWFKKIGEKVNEGDILAEIETDKATMEFESFNSGILLHIGINEGESGPVDTILAIIGEKGADFAGVLTAQPSIDSISQKSEIDPKEIQVETLIKENEITSSDNDFNSVEKKEKINQEVETSISNQRKLASPLAKKIAKEKGLDINLIKGSGDGGRVIKRDIVNFQYKPTDISKSQIESIKEISNSQMRKTIAKRLSSSKFTAPHYYLSVEFDMDNCISFRNQLNSFSENKISFNDILIKATALSLAKHPDVNSTWYDDKIVHHNHVHMGVAVAVSEGLVVPVLRFADQENISQIGIKVKDFASRAREKKLTQSEIEGSTFTISNLGMFGIKEFTSIINQPNSAILSVGSIMKKPVVKEGEIVIGNTMKLTLACDHRSVDGATGSRFLGTLKLFVENPATILL
ncbi:MAG: 2-oxo acid dehydrogenase subunit E2 [Flavobacteriaceae bacterium]|nr:2-oxo acid dehydrogenase subunit E2 [Flavobacteriaceae bacterium]